MGETFLQLMTSRNWSNFDLSLFSLSEFNLVYSIKVCTKMSIARRILMRNRTWMKWRLHLCCWTVGELCKHQWSHRHWTETKIGRIFLSVVSNVKEGTGLTGHKGTPRDVVCTYIHLHVGAASLSLLPSSLEPGEDQKLGVQVCWQLRTCGVGT